MTGAHQQVADHRTLPRRRGEVLLDAIFAAALAELAEAGYAGLSMERVAARARTSKASLYKRWPSRAELVVAAVRSRAGADAGCPPDTGDLRADMLAILRRAADRFAGPEGEAVRGLMLETLADPQRTADVRARIAGTRSRLIRQVLARAADRGDIARQAVTDRIADLAPALLAHHFLTTGTPIDDAVLAEIIDEIVLPLLHHRSEPASQQINVGRASTAMTTGGLPGCAGCRGQEEPVAAG